MKIKIKFLVDTVLLISFVVASISAFMGRGAREFHEISGKIMIAAAIIHIILNWKPYLAILKSAFRKPVQPSQPTESTEQIQ